MLLSNKKSKPCTKLSKSVSQTLINNCFFILNTETYVAKELIPIFLGNLFFQSFLTTF